MSRVLHHWLKVLRLPALSLLVLAVLVNPVFASLGDLHETAQAEAGHLHDVGKHEAGVAAEDHDGDSDFMHALMHASHCCGHLTGIVAGLHWQPLPLLAATAPSHVVSARPLHVPVNHFRPPITA